MLPRRNVTQRRRFVFDQVLKSANCSSLDCLRHASPKTLMAANRHVLVDSHGESGGATFGPGIGLGPFPDGGYLPDAMTVLFSEGRFNKQVRSVISGNMAAEGLGLTPEVEKESDFAQLVRRLIPGASNSTIQRIRALYPYPGTQMQQVANDWTTDVAFGCNAHAIAKAYANITQRYVFSVPPATHGLDLSCTSDVRICLLWDSLTVPDLFYMDNATTPVASVSLAWKFQSQALDFVHGHDVAANAKAWPVYGNESSLVNITVAGFKKTVDPWATKSNCHQILRVILDERNGA